MYVNRNFLFFLLIIPIILIVGNRGATLDTYNYYYVFKNIDNFDLTSYWGFYSESGFELGWGLYSKAISIVSNSSFVLFSIFSFLIFLVIYKISNIYKLNYLHVMCFYLSSGFFMLQQFMQIRQAFAVPVALLASLLFLKDLKLKAFLLFLLAFLFHQITLAFFLVFLSYLILDKKYPLGFSLKRLYTLSSLFIVITFILCRVVFLPLAFSLFDRLVAYSNDDQYSESVSFFSLANIKYYVEFIIILLLTNDKLIKDKNFIYMFFLFVIGLTLRVSFYDFEILSGRLSNVFLFIEIFILPYIFYHRLKSITFYLVIFFYFLVVGFTTWYFRAAPFLEQAYFIPLG